MFFFARDINLLSYINQTPTVHHYLISVTHYESLLCLVFVVVRESLDPLATFFFRVSFHDRFEILYSKWVTSLRKKSFVCIPSRCTHYVIGTLLGSVDHQICTRIGCDNHQIWTRIGIGCNALGECPRQILSEAPPPSYERAILMYHALRLQRGVPLTQ